MSDPRPAPPPDPGTPAPGSATAPDSVPTPELARAPEPARVRDRQVVYVATVIVVAVLATQLLDILVPPFDHLLGFEPVVAVMLVVVTVWILFASLRSAARR